MKTITINNTTTLEVQVYEEKLKIDKVGQTSIEYNAEVLTAGLARETLITVAPYLSKTVTLDTNIEGVTQSIPNLVLYSAINIKRDGDTNLRTLLIFKETI